MPEYLAPGVYVEEISTAPGRSRGEAPARPDSWAKPNAGRPADARHELGRLPAYVRRLRGPATVQPNRTSISRTRFAGFFDNGGQRAFVARVSGPGARRRHCGHRQLRAPGDRRRRLGQQRRRLRSCCDRGAPRHAHGRLVPHPDRLLPRGVPNPFVDPSDPNLLGDPNRVEPTAFEDFDNLSPVTATATSRCRRSTRLRNSSDDARRARRGLAMPVSGRAAGQRRGRGRNTGGVPRRQPARSRTAARGSPACWRFARSRSSPRRTSGHRLVCASADRGVRGAEGSLCDHVDDGQIANIAGLRPPRRHLYARGLLPVDSRARAAHAGRPPADHLGRPRRRHLRARRHRARRAQGAGQRGGARHRDARSRAAMRSRSNSRRQARAGHAQPARASTSSATSARRPRQPRLGRADACRPTRSGSTSTCGGCSSSSSSRSTGAPSGWCSSRTTSRRGRAIRSVDHQLPAHGVAQRRAAWARRRTRRSSSGATARR